MRQFGKKPTLFEELPLQHLGLFVVTGERLECIVRSELLVHDLVNIAHPTLSEHSDNGVRAYLIAGTEGHSLTDIQR